MTIDIDSNTRQIPLNKGKFAIVDAEDYEWLMQWKWHITPSGYAVRTERACETGKERSQLECLFMHREILKAPKEFEGDHIDRNPLNNSRSNLRLATRSQNGMNTRKPQRAKVSSKYKGVSYSNEKKRGKKWKAAIYPNNKCVFIGHFKTEKEAALSYNEKAKELFGEFAYLNVI